VQAKEEEEAQDQEAKFGEAREGLEGETELGGEGVRLFGGVWLGRSVVGVLCVFWGWREGGGRWACVMYDARWVVGGEKCVGIRGKEGRRVNRRDHNDFATLVCP
jgi:hypothetical protein